MIAAVLFDNDGVLVDTETLFFRTTRSAFADLGVGLTRGVWCSRYLTAGGRSADIAIALGADPARVPAVIEERNRRYRVLLKQAPPLRPHVQEVLEVLRDRVKLALVTGCGRDQLDLVHSTPNLLSFFDVVVTSDDCARSKPDPEPYLTALGLLGVRAEQAIAVEDSPRGLASARAAGLRCIVTPTELTRPLEFPGALAVEENILGLLRHL